MDQNRFDDLTRALVDRPSRRGVLKAAVGTIIAGMATVTGRGIDAAPRCKRIAQACQTSADCCPGDLGNGDVYCAPNGKKSKTCQVCPSGTVACKGGCTNVLGSDAGNCGACGQSCTGGRVCVGGQCQCPSGTTECGGACVNTTSDPVNCGGCGRRCPLNEDCEAGTCRCGNFGESQAPWTCCPGGASACTDPTASTGGLRLADTCELADSSFRCPDGYTLCSGDEGTAEPYDTCKVCCPPGTTCNSFYGYCVQ